METTLKLKLTAIAIAQAFLLGSVQAYAAGTADKDVYENDFTSLDNNTDGVLDGNEAADDKVFDDMSDSVVKDHWDTADVNKDGFWDQNEYVNYRTYDRIDSDNDGLVAQKEALDNKAFGSVADGVFDYRWNIADANKDGLLNPREYIDYLSEYAT